MVVEASPADTVAEADMEEDTALAVVPPPPPPADLEHKSLFRRIRSPTLQHLAEREARRSTSET